MATIQSPASQFDALKALIVTNLDKYEAGLRKQGLPKPNMVDTHPFDDPNVALPSQELFDVQNQLLGALHAMHSIIEPAQTQLHMNIGTGHIAPSCLDVFVNANVADALESAGPSGISSSALAAKTKVEEGKLIHVLRFLSTQYMVRETSPKVFASTRLSRQLVNGNLVRSWMMCNSVLGITAASEFRKSVIDPATSHSYEQEDSALALYYDFKGNGYTNQWEWMAEKKPDFVNEFGVAMVSLSVFGNAAYLSDYPWAALGGSTVVDVGGGVGSFLLSILKENPQLKGIVQDRPETVKLGPAHFAEHLPEALNANRVEFEVVDFFKEQVRSGDEYVYLMRYVMHYPDNVVIAMLKALADKMTMGSRLLLAEAVLPSTVETSGANLYPLTEATSSVQKYGYNMDILQLQGFNACERDLSEFEYITSAAGLKIAKVHHLRNMWAIMEIRLRDWTA